MDIWSSYSMLAMVTAAVVYLLAVVVHAAEWASARHASEKVVVRRNRRVPVLVGGSSAAAGDATVATAHRADGETDGTDGTGGGGIAGLGTSPPRDEEADSGRARTDRLGRIGIALTIVALLSQVLAVVLRGIAAQRLPWGNMYEFTSTSLIFLVVAYLVLALRFGARWLGLPVTMLATIGLGLAVTVFYVDVAPLVPSLHSVWFLFHILAATVAGAAFTIGGIGAVFWLLRSRAEAAGEVRGYLSKLPSADRIDKFTYATLAFAFPLFTFVIAAGAVWAQYAWGRPWGWDPKETWSLVTWVIFAAYLHARSTAGWKGKPAAIIAIVGAVSFWWNFVGINLLVSGLHSYAK